MNDASRLLDGDLSPLELARLLRRLHRDPTFRDAVSSVQLVRDAITGNEALDDGYTQRILERVRTAAAIGGVGRSLDSSGVGLKSS